MQERRREAVVRRFGRAFLLLVILALIVLVTIWAVPRRNSAPAEDSIEAGFARDMAVHHAQAVEMSEIIRQRTDDSELRLLATDITLTQQAQIGMISGWLAAWGLNQTRTGQPPMAWSGMSMPLGSKMPGIASREDVASLKTLPLGEAERKYLQLMIAHHRAGVEMAKSALKLQVRSPVDRFASSIVQSQQAEIRTMTEMLRLRSTLPS